MREQTGLAPLFLPITEVEFFIPPALQFFNLRGKRRKFLPMFPYREEKWCQSRLSPHYSSRLRKNTGTG